MDDDFFVSRMAKFYAIHNYNGYMESLPDGDEIYFYQKELLECSQAEITEFIKICIGQRPNKSDDAIKFLKEIGSKNLALNIWEKVKAIPVIFFHAENLNMYSTGVRDSPAIMMEWKLFSKIDYFFHLYQQANSNLNDIVFSDEMTDAYSNAFKDIASWSSTTTIFPPPDFIKFLPLKRKISSFASRLSVLAKTFWLLCEYGHQFLKNYHRDRLPHDLMTDESHGYIFSTEEEITADIFAIEAICHSGAESFEYIIQSIGALLRFMELRKRQTQQQDVEDAGSNNQRLKRWENIKVYARNKQASFEKIELVDALFDRLQNKQPSPLERHREIATKHR